MNENIDLTKILKDCTKGFEFYSTLFGEVRVIVCNRDVAYPIMLFKSENDTTPICTLSKLGKYNSQFNGECTLFPSKDQRDWSKFCAPWYKKERFDPKTLQQYDKVIGRDSNDDIWECSLFSHIREHESFPYRCVGTSFVYCIPYNDETKHLVGTTDEAPEYYEYWED